MTHLFHDLKTAGHPRISNTLTLIQPHYWWPGIKEYITNYIQGCRICQMNKINTHPTHPPIFPITPTSSLPFQMVTIDFVIKLPPSYGYDSILTITDHDVSKGSIFIPYTKSIDSVGIAELYAKYVFLHYGIPLKIISNRDPQFTSALATNL